MPDTGAAAAQEIEMALKLVRSGVGQSYADVAAFEAAGWTLPWRMAQADQTFTYTIQPHSVAAMATEGWHLVVLTLVDGEGDLLVGKPAGAGWSNTPKYFRIRAEQTDHDDAYNAILQSIGVAVASDTAVVVDWTVTDDDSFMRQFTARNTSLALFGYDSSDLTNGTLALEGSIRAVDNRAGIPDAWMAVTVVTADDGEDPVLRNSWADYPSAQASIQSGLDYPSSDPSNDAEIGPRSYSWQTRAVGTQSFAVTAVNTADDKFTISGDHRKWFAVGGAFSKTGTAAANYIVESITVTGGNTVITVTGDITDATADGNLTVTVKITLGKGTITTESRDIRP